MQNHGQKKSIPAAASPQRLTLLLALLSLLALPAGVGAYEIGVAPGSARIVPGQNNVLSLLYTGTMAGDATFTSISTQGRFESADGRLLLGTVDRTVAISHVNGRGRAAEALTVPPTIIAAALRAQQGRIYFRRFFQPNLDQIGLETAVVLEIVPPSAGTFSLVRMELGFNQLAADDNRSGGGRITIPRNTPGLTASATITYNGGGILQGQWKVDGRPINFVTRQLPPGLRVAVIQSPSFPGFPTYKTGLHRVEFELLTPEPGFTQPAIFYFVSEKHPEPLPQSLQLKTPTAGAQLRLLAEQPATFSWHPAGEGLIYRFTLHPLDDRFAFDPRNPLPSGEQPPLTIARTKETSYALTEFDRVRISPGAPYAWQVEAFAGDRLVAASDHRLIFFAHHGGGGTEELKPTIQAD
ncbi:hypothetical protein ACHHRT_08550 [Desulfurivibrio sp. D14AmB]|uniref:hypothetical protein n=1 Tax=Desulfurivibrio sp. D14AmB TaxID=3374370 RepID=UPI00376ED3CB